MAHQFLPGLALVLLFGTGSARAGEDVLECQTRAGDRFALRSAYKERWLPALTPHNSSTYDRQPWRGAVLGAKDQPDASGLESMQIRFVGSQRWALDAACAEFGNALGTPLAQDRFRTTAGVWTGPGDLPAAPPGVVGLLEPSPELQQRGFIRRGPARLSPLRPTDPEHVVYEIALYRSKAHDAGVAAVWQSQSDDGGRHWSAASTTEPSRLFELGRPLANSCLVARATRFNGEALVAAWPADCAAMSVTTSP